MDTSARDEVTKDSEDIGVKLEDLLFIPFYNAMEANDKSLVGVELTDDEFEDLITDFRVISKGKQSNFQKQIDDAELKKLILLNACIVLKFRHSDVAVESIRAEGYTIPDIPDDDDIEEILKKIKLLDRKIRQVTRMLPPTTRTGDLAGGAYDILVGMSMALEFSFDFEKCTVGAFIAYNRSLKKKADNIKAIKNG